MAEELMPIGRFARLCRLSVKQLRHYDELGLLSPAWVDPDTGYRYYRADQALLAWIGERGHVPSGEIREVYLSDPRQTAAEHLITQLMIRIEED